jgi:hypothetical protein
MLVGEFFNPLITRRVIQVMRKIIHMMRFSLQHTLTQAHDKHTTMPNHRPRMARDQNTEHQDRVTIDKDHLKDEPNSRMAHVDVQPFIAPREEVNEWMAEPDRT